MFDIQKQHAELAGALEDAAAARRYVIASFRTSGNAAMVTITLQTPDFRREYTRTIDKVGAVPAVDCANMVMLRAEAHFAKPGMVPATALLPKIPPMFDVTSNSIGQVGFDNAVLYVRFKLGKLYSYPGVTREEFNKLRESASVGKHLQVHIMTKYSGSMVPEGDG